MRAPIAKTPQDPNTAAQLDRIPHEIRKNPHHQHLCRHPMQGPEGNRRQSTNSSLTKKAQVGDEAEKKNGNQHENKLKSCTGSPSIPHRFLEIHEKNQETWQEAERKT
jgi:hypothetical protein